MGDLLTLAADPAAWAALVTLVVMEVVLGIDNLIFISILTNKLPEAQRARARRHRHRAGADHAAGAARHDRLHRAADHAGLHRCSATASPGAT